MKKVGSKRFVVIDKDCHLFSLLTGHPSLKGLLSAYSIHSICPSLPPRVQDLIEASFDWRQTAVVVLNLTSLEGEIEPLLDWLRKRVSTARTVLVCSERKGRLPLAGKHRMIVASGTDDEIVEIMQLVLENSTLSGLLEEKSQLAAKFKGRNRQLRREIADLRAIGEISRSISSTLLIEEILTGILKGIRQVLSLDRVMLGLVNAVTGEEEIKVAVGVANIKTEDYRWPISADDPVWTWLRNQGKPLILNQNSRADLPAFLRQTFGKKFVKAPMIVKDQIVGTIMGDKSSGKITTRELRLLQIFVEYAGIAIENGRLYYDVIRSEEELKRTQRQLVEAERLAVIGQLAVSINHEINNPLCNISLISQTLRKKLEERAADLVPRLAGIDQNVERIRKVTKKVAEITEAQSTEYLPDQLMISLK
jgi:GAF domain-containing protein